MSPPPTPTPTPHPPPPPHPMAHLLVGNDEPVGSALGVLTAEREGVYERETGVVEGVPVCVLEAVMELLRVPVAVAESEGVGVVAMQEPAVAGLLQLLLLQKSALV